MQMADKKGERVGRNEMNRLNPLNVETAVLALSAGDNLNRSFAFNSSSTNKNERSLVT